MEKDKIIEYILSEWALRSHDGLASGHNTFENIEAFEDILLEYGLSETEIEEVMVPLFNEAIEPEIYGDDRDYLFKVMDPKEKGKVSHFISVGHPDQEKYPDKAIYNGPRQYSDDKKYKRANVSNLSNALVKAEKDTTLKALRNQKSVSIANVQKLKNVFENFSNQALVKRYKDMFDTIPTIEEAIEIYKGELYPEFQPLINAIDDVKFAGGGRGEIPIVFILKGARSGGGTEMDILFAELADKKGGVEVKEVTGATIAISAPTLTGFSNSKFNVAIHELALAANKTEGMKDFIKKVLEDDGTLFKEMGPFEKMVKYKSAIDAFFQDPKVGEVSQFLLDAIFIVSEKIKNPISGEKKELGSVEIDIGKKHREFKVPDDQVAALNAKIDSVTGEKATLDVPVEPKIEKDDASIAEKCMKLSFFRENWDEGRVQAEIMDLILKKYKRMIIISKKKGTNDAQLYDENRIKTLEFVALGFGKIYMYVLGMGKSKAQAAAGAASAETSTA
jgi:hypothetical protein